MAQVMDHVRELAEGIGPRPATTDAEARAADYIEGVFEARGLDVERQEFDCPRTYSWTFAIYHLLTIASAVVSRWAAVPALVIAAAVAVAMWLDLDTRFSIARFLPRGPSQNIIARHLPRARRGERVRKIVIVAHYDSAKASLAFSPGLVRNFSLSFGLMKWTTFATPLVIAVGALPFMRALAPWTWYAALAACAYLLVPLFINVHRELFMPATDGANDNASGVAVMLGVMEATVPEPEEGAARTSPLRRGLEAAYEADVVIEDALLEYRPEREAEPVGPAGPLGAFGDVGWETGPMPAAVSEARTASPAPPGEADPTALPEPLPGFPRGAGVWPEEDIVWDEEPVGRERVADEEVADTQQRLDLGDEGPVLEEPRPSETVERGKGRRRGRGAEEAHTIRDWLGVGRGFDVRKAGKEIGGWEGLADHDEDDEFGFKAGDAGGPLSLDDRFIAEEAARIRRRVTERVDRALAEKEIWFVATGAEESGTYGMRALIDAYGEDLKDALIINIDNVGAGTVAYVTEEGMARRYHCDRRLAAQAKRTAREREMPVRGVPYRGLSTDATPALARRLHAMSVMAFDINGRLPNWHWTTDTVENVQEHTLEQAVEFVTALVRDL
jgi:hypothetical protein